MLKRLTGAVAVVTVASVLMAGALSPAGADDNLGGGGQISGGQISAWTFAYHSMGASGGNKIPCQLNGIPTIPAEFADKVPTGYQMPTSVPGHIAFVSKGGGLLPDLIAESMNLDAVGGTHYVVICKPDDGFIRLLPPGAGLALFGWLFQIINLLVDQNFQEIVFVPDGGPQMTLDAALAMLGLGTPTIITSPSQGVGGSIVGLDTWFSIDPGIWHPYRKTLSSTAAGATVTANIFADPVSLEFDTGEGVIPCPYAPGPQYSGNPGEPHCGHTYRSSHIGHAIEATITYDGGYTVSVGGGETATIARTGDGVLTVTEGEAINQ